MDINRFKKQREEVASFMRRLYERNLTTSKGGNISIRGDENYFCITPSSLDKSTLNESLIAVVDMDGNKLTSDLNLSIETLMHRLILKNNREINGVVHSHSPYATAFGLTNIPININLTGESYLILKNLKRISYYKMGTEELAQAVAESVKTNDVLLLQNHGVLSVGKTLLDAFEKIEVLEYCAKMSFITEMLSYKSGSVINTLDESKREELDLNRKL